MRAKIFYHGSCFDGATSAALFAAFYRARHPGSELAYRPMAHTSGDPFADVVLDGDDNACVDFRYCADPRMNWWFDHHVSAFQPKDLRATFDANVSQQKVFDPTARSCALLIDNSLREQFDFSLDSESWRELVRWADKIDGAQFDSAREVVELKAPALKLTTWLSHCDDAAAASALIEQLGQRPLAEIAVLPFIADPLEPLLAEGQRQIELIEQRACISGDIVFYDLSADGVGAHNKFIAYMLFPAARYTVGLTCSSDAKPRISVGSNPWGPPRTHNIASICERFGGGGHPFVGGITFGDGTLNTAKRVAVEICELLSQEPST